MGWIAPGRATTGISGCVVIPTETLEAGCATWRCCHPADGRRALSALRRGQEKGTA